MSVINWGIIGLGNIAYNFASAFEQVKNSFICDHSATKPILTPHLRIEKVKLMAERVGFEPTVPLTVHKLSKPAP